MDDFDPFSSADLQGPHVDDYPEKPENSDWYLMGIWDKNRAVYLDSKNRSLHFVHREDDQLIEDMQNKIEERGRDLYDIIIGESTKWDTWSKYSWPCYMTIGIYDGPKSVFTKQEALVYSYRELCEHKRNDTADILGKSANTIDNQLYSAKHKLDHAVDVVDYLRNDLEIID